MTVVNPKSISGINSITMASGSDDLLTIHSNNTTERVRVNNSGDVIVGSGITLSPDGDIFATGVCTATSFSGDGSALTGVAATDNVRTGILDVAGVGTFRGDVNIPDKIIHLGDTNTAIRFPAADTITAETGGTERLRIDSNGQVLIGTSTSSAYGNRKLAVGDTTDSGSFIEIRCSSSGTGHLLFADSAAADSNNYTGYIGYNHSSNAMTFHTNGGNERLRILSGGGLTFNGDTATANALDDYEEGDWTPQIQGTTGAGTATYSTQTGKYLKIGGFVYLTAEVNWSSGSAGGELRITNLPFSPTTDCEGIGNAMFHSITIDSDTANISPYVGPNNDYMYFYQSRQGTQAWRTLDYDSAGSIIMNVAFRVA